MRTQLPSLKRGRSLLPNISAHVYCGQTAGWIKMALGIEVGLDPRHVVLDGDPSPLPRKKAEPPISAHFCGQTAGCITMALGAEVGLSPGDFVLDGDPAPSPKRDGAPVFGPLLFCPNGYMDQDATWYAGRPRSTRHCVRWGPRSPSRKGTAPNFRSLSVVAKRLDGLRCHLVWR